MVAINQHNSVMAKDKVKNQEKEELLQRKGKARRYAKDYHLSISGKSTKEASIVKTMIHEYERKLLPET